MGIPALKLVLLASLCLSSVKCDEAAGAASTASSGTSGSAPPPVVPPAGPALPGLPPGLGGLAGLLPGLGGGAGFSKHLNINAGAGAGFAPFLGGLGGLGGLGALGGLGGLGAGVPPPEGIDPALAGGLGGPFGLLGPSYIPSTWIGSALGAKGDLLFPIVLFVFFIVGLWTVVQFLLALIVPLIAAKFAILQGANPLRHRRSTPQEEKEAEVEHLTNVVWAAFENYGCMKTSACYTGNMIHSMAGKENVKPYEGFLDTMKIMDKEVVEIFKKACDSGKEDCTQYPCDAFGVAKLKKPDPKENQVH